MSFQLLFHFITAEIVRSFNSLDDYGLPVSAVKGLVDQSMLAFSLHFTQYVSLLWLILE